jgi:isopentenyldiphosphate isomerase
MPELYQCYDDQGQPLTGQTVTKADSRAKGVLHAASHVWIWRKTSAGPQVLLQKRSAHMQTWPNYLDISAAGHINPGEDPITAALRETKEEIGLDLQSEDLQVIHTYKAYITTEAFIENEFQFIYLVQFPESAQPSFTMQQGEVDSLIWKDFSDFKREVLDPETTHYVPHGDLYFKAVIRAIEQAIQL